MRPATRDRGHNHPSVNVLCRPRFDSTETRGEVRRNRGRDVAPMDGAHGAPATPVRSASAKITAITTIERRTLTAKPLTRVSSKASCADRGACRGGVPGIFGARRNAGEHQIGGGGGIRTHGRVAPSAVFKTARFDRSRTPPSRESMHLAGGNGCHAARVRLLGRLVEWHALVQLRTSRTWECRRPLFEMRSAGRGSRRSPPED